MKKELYPQKLDVAVIGGGHNGLISSFYLSQKNLSVGVFENRSIIGGAAVTEEIIQGYRFSRCSYLYSLFRPQIVQDMNLINRKNGLKLLKRSPSSFTPLKDNKNYLFMGDSELNYKEISKFSKKDAENYQKYEEELLQLVKMVDPLFDQIPLQFQGKEGFKAKIDKILPILKGFKGRTNLIPQLVQILTAPTAKILNQWFESEPLKCTLAYDSIIGAQISPYQNGSSYVLLHHFMGENDPSGESVGWQYVEGGMGRLSEILAEVTAENGTQIYVDSGVKQILLSEDGRRAEGIELNNGHKIKTKQVLSNATAHHTYLDLLPDLDYYQEFKKKEKQFDYKSPVFKLNVALNKIPEFKKYQPGEHGPEHCGTIHLGADNLEEMHKAYEDSEYNKIVSKNLLIEMSLPTTVDKTLVDNKNNHTCGLFIQYVPYDLPWEKQEYKDNFVKEVFRQIDHYAPGFSESVVGYDALSPKDLEQIIGLTGGNIFQGSMSLDQLYFNRASYQSPVQNLYICGSSAHPGGGVTGAPGRNCAKYLLNQLKIK
ncbi:hypothetical protein PPERSA_07736 [Pseudocohnilembus persalinus]|uniref:Amine oxidase domain-containing protein n=1 Tax=Pseudocohnilembus persalinus TaxID=266149 RepID=A0A0V0R9R0_PSEPJ|nr:hypothetical protein PPERSA_07736 [Pseudocohnilembus persalinus]|eukprot:KRX11211.1 hypothetical protein PPERSA_07736 [Pseudocohnilembus persalinus]